jgi:enamine deaminase RidA (YjgF/YER057c/UK114 family)
MTAGERIAELGLTLPTVAAPIGSYQPAVVLGNLVYTSGQLPMVEGVLTLLGRLGAEVSVEAGAGAARTAGLNAVSAVANVAGGIDNIIRVVKVTVFVAGTPDFTDQPKVANGASDLLTEIFGSSGVHARSAVGVSSLPMNSPVEVEIVAQVVS